MHSRRRKFGDGGRSNSMERARAPSEGSASGQGVYDSDYRSFNRSYDRGYNSKPPPPLRKGDIFIEAGRLATEYLISRGMLSPDALVDRKNVKHGDVRGHDRNNLPPSEGRTSALARLGSVSGSGSKRRLNDEYGSRHHSKRRRSESAKGHGSDGGRNGSLSDKSKDFSSSVEGEEEYTGGRHEIRSRISEDVFSETVVSDELTPENDAGGHSKTMLDTCEFPDHGDSEVKSPCAAEGISETKQDEKKATDDVQIIDLEDEEDENSACDEKKLQNRNSNGNALILDNITHAVNDGFDRSYNNDLLNYCAFAKVPTRARSSLASKVTKRDDSVDNEDEPHLVDASSESKEPISTEENVECSLTELTKQAFGLSNSSSGTGEILSLQSVEEPGKLKSVYVMEKQMCVRSQSFPDRSSFLQDEHEGQSPPGFARSRSSELLGVNDSLLRLEVSQERGMKRSRELDSHADDMFEPLHSKRKSAFNNVHVDTGMIDAVDHTSQINAPMTEDGRTEQTVEMTREEINFPDSMKICDLNFSEASVSESPKNIIPDLKSIDLSSSLKTDDEEPLDVGLSICNVLNGNKASDAFAVSNNSKDIIVVDDEDDVVIGNTVFNNIEKRSDPVYSNIENFLSHTENNVEIPHVHDGYGLVSEFLGNDVSNCSHVSTEIDDLHNEMALHNHVIIPGDDDDQIFLSLGEIPLSFVGMWDQPNQDYGKPFQ